MPRVACPACGFDVVVDPGGRCPDGHLVVPPDATPQPPAAPAEPSAPPGSAPPSDLLRELHSLAGRAQGADVGASPPGTGGTAAAPTASEEMSAYDELDQLAALESASTPPDTPPPSAPAPPTGGSTTGPDRRVADGDPVTVTGEPDTADPGAAGDEPPDGADHAGQGEDATGDTDDGTDATAGRAEIDRALPPGALAGFTARGKPVRPARRRTRRRR